ncbi:MAG: PilZ domain protein [Acidobacteria bacterium ADurb.Bin340]|nr:MAG: PilZ domain protein [Acidobacteria bacterium ADurb.Bin340]HQL48219.1 PilZ domain-containing protein [Holophaga sp.]
MTPERTLTDSDLAALLQRAREASAPASIRAVGSVRLLGDLRVNGLEPGRALHLGGVRRRDQLLPLETPVTLSLVMGDEVFALQSRLIEPILSPVGDTQVPPILRLAWPSPRIEVHRRSQVRVGTPDLPPLQARIFHQGQHLDAEMLNLTETGVGLGLTVPLMLEPHTLVDLETRLPGGQILRVVGEVRHLEWLEGDRLPTRVGLVLGAMEEAHREALRRFIQVRRTVRSESLRQGF